MMNFNKIMFGLFMTILLPEFIHAIPVIKMKLGTDISLSYKSTHIARISNDTLVLVTGSTNSFTVDTSEDKGLISTGIMVDQLNNEIQSADGSTQFYQVIKSDGTIRLQGQIESGDVLKVSSHDGKITHQKTILLKRMALSGELSLQQKEATAGTIGDLTVRFTAGQRTPDATVRIYIPSGIQVSELDIMVDVIGRGTVRLADLSNQSIGRVGSRYSYSKVGIAEIIKLPNRETCLEFRNLDLRPSNGADLVITFKNVNLPGVGQYKFRANYSTSEPEKLTSLGIGKETAILTVKNYITDFKRIVRREAIYHETPQTYSSVRLNWTPIVPKKDLLIEYSTDTGATWKPCPVNIDNYAGYSEISGLEKNKEHSFRLKVRGGKHAGYSNIARFYTGKLDVKQFGTLADGMHDDTNAINKAIEYLHSIGGGTLLFSEGIYNVRTIHLKSNVYLYIDKGATIKALRGSDEPETSWFSGKKYRSGLSPTDSGPYADPENFLTKQDVGHSYFQNAMFFGQRLDNVKIIGNGRINGDGNLATSDKVMNNEHGRRADKMFSLKLCTNLEIGGIFRYEDLWYDSEKDEPYYIGGMNMIGTDNMLNIDQGGHFVLLATGTDSIQIHDIYQGRNSSSNVRDILDFMACNEVNVSNIYCKVSSDDIVKLGSDCSLGFTRPANNYKVRNIIGDTNCNLFQIGSETADDITDVCVDNIYVLGSNKAGFSISTNDGGHVRNIHLNCGETGSIHARSKMYRTTTPFFISISNRGRVLGAEVSRYKFSENGMPHDELLCTNIDIGGLENIELKAVDCSEVYSGSSFRSNRWEGYDGTQKKSTPIVAGYELPDSKCVEGGLNFKLPNGQHTGYINNIHFEDVHVLVKGGNPLSDCEKSPPELGVGQYNVSNLGIQPAYGIWIRHAKNINIENCSFNYEKPDSRYAIFLDDVHGAKLNLIKMVKAHDNIQVVKLLDSKAVNIENSIFYQEAWGTSPTKLPFQNDLKGNIGIPF